MSTPTFTDLRVESDLLHLLFHRNKNQHHASKWWKWLGMLRRSIKKLLDPSVVTGVEKRVDYMRRVLVPSCYTAFTSVVANTQFAPLGLALLGILARVHRVIGAEKREEGVEVVVAGVVREETVELDMEDLGEAIARREESVEEEEDVGIQNEMVDVAKPNLELSKERPTAKDAKRRDGKVIKKKNADSSPSLPLKIPSLLLVKEERPSVKSKRKPEDKDRAKKKKKRKKVDEIDDLFAGLL